MQVQRRYVIRAGGVSFRGESVVESALCRDGAVCGSAGGRPAADQSPGKLVAICDPSDACQVLRETLDRIPHPQRSVQLTGRFAVEAVEDPESECSGFVSEEVLGRGHSVRLLIPQSVTLRPTSRPRLLALNSQGARIRVCSGPLPNLALAAAEIAITDTRARDGQPKVLIVRREATSALHQFQQTLWDQAVELVQPRNAVRAPELDAVQSQVLRMLGCGMKDDTAARQLDVSVRTYRRHVAAILKALGVSTRFEAGLKAAELGLLGRQQRGQGPASSGPGQPPRQFQPDLLVGGVC